MSNSAALLGPRISFKTVGYAYRTNKNLHFSHQFCLKYRRFLFLALPSVLYQPFEIGFCHVLLNWPRLDKTNSIITGACSFFFKYCTYRTAY